MGVTRAWGTLRNKIEAPPQLCSPSTTGQPWSDAPLDPPKHATILVVDDLEANREAMRALLENDGHLVLTARCAGDGLEILNQAPVDLILLDMLLPVVDGMEFCRRIRANRRMELVPVLMLSRLQTVEHEIDGMSSGADGFLGRPFHPEILRARIRSMLRRKSIVDRLEESESILLALAQTVEQRDSNTAGHCDRLAAMGVAMGIVMELPSPHLLALHRGGYLHDIGKIAVPDSVLLKKGSLTEDEWKIMRTHTSKGEDICRPIKCLTPVLPIIRSHHERWDGSGYPDGLAGNNTPLLARVLQFADIYDALTSVRPYKSAMTSPDALRVMQEETDRGWHDPELMGVFMRLRHEVVREAVEHSATEWQDVNVMQESLANLRSSILRY